jgi:heat shock protein HslJ
MRQTLSVIPRLLLLCALSALHGCASATAPATADLSLEALQNLAYAGIEDDGTALQLKAGRWEGTPPEPGSAVVPTLDLRAGALARGDLDGDGNAEAVVVLDSWTGGSGVFTYLAVVSGRTGTPRNLATQLLGDRLQLRDVRIENGRIVSDLHGPGPDDPSCCPSMNIRQVWKLTGSGLEEVPESRLSTRISVKELEGSHWELASWSADEAAAGEPVVSLSFAAGRFSGHAGCNRYGAAARDGDSPGSLVVSPAMATRMACEESRMGTENRFLRLLPAVQSFRFTPGMLMLAYPLPDGRSAELGFRAVAAP